MKKKYFITLAGGLGNQMLQYSLFLYLKENSYNCHLYYKLDSLNQHNGFELNSIFPNLNIPFYNNKAVDTYCKFFKKLQKADGFLKNKYRVTFIEAIIKSLPYQIINFPTWHDYTFINKIETPIWETFKFKQLDVLNSKICETISENNSVSIHVRRGDYVNDLQWRKVLGDVCDLKYYLKAIELISKEIDNPLYVIFSDDIIWVKNNFNIKNAIYVEGNINTMSYKDMQLMSMCKHNIIANSTFSLMAAWLNQNTNKIVLCPNKWRNYPNDSTNILYIPNEWRLIDNRKPNVSLIFNSQISTKSLKEILSQSYRDFEVILSNDDISLLIDNRIFCKSNSKIRGNHIFEFGLNEETDFSDRNLINDLLEKKLKELL